MSSSEESGDDKFYRHDLIIGEVKHSVGLKSRIQCYYCGNEYLVSSISSHWQSSCKEAIIESGKDYKDVQKSVSEGRKKRKEKIDSSSELQYEERLKRNKKRWIKEHENKTKKPDNHYLVEWLPKFNKHIFLYWDKKSTDLQESEFSIEVRTELYSKISSKLKEISLNVLAFRYSSKQATMDDHKQMVKMCAKTYRTLKVLFHPDK